MKRPATALSLATTLAVALLLAAPTDARAFGFYMTGSLGEAAADSSFGDSFQRVIDGEDSSWSAGFGLQLNRYIDFQLEYHDLGEVPGFAGPCPAGAGCLAPVSPIVIDSTALSLSVLPTIEVTERIKLFAKLGVVTRESSVSDLVDRAESLADDFDDEELLYGAGVRVRLVGPLGAFVQYQRFGDAFDEVAVGATLGYD